MTITLWRKNFAAYLLWPLSLLYRGFLVLRRQYYQWDARGTNGSSVPVVVIGNITVGGSGKTPLLIALATFLQKKGWNPGVISRGYGGRSTRYPVYVHARSNPREVGDEPILIARHTTCPTVVDPDRNRGIKALHRKANCNVILSDDGLQHLALDRVIEIVVIDGQRRFGNGFCLPAGPMREPISRLKTVDFIVNKGGPLAQDEFSMSLVPDYCYQLVQPGHVQKLDFFMGKEVHAVAGIGNPEQFFSSLRAMGLTIIEHPCPDHHFFGPHDFNYGETAIILMTEKDAVKCEGLIDNRLWCLCSKVELEPTFYTAFYQRLMAHLPKAAHEKIPAKPLPA